MVDDKGLVDTAAFLVAKLGGRVEARFAEALGPLGLRPRHCGLLSLLASDPAPQMDLARRLGVTPSVVVDMVDELEKLMAVRRVRDATDRRRQVVELTARGKRLLTKSVAVARALDAELLALVPVDEHPVLLAGLRRLGDAYRIPGQPTPG
ncbi:MAG: MarR family transcriptional regulator [Pseudonocardiales bacterium]